MSTKSDKLWSENKKKIDLLIKQIIDESERGLMTYEQIVLLAKESLKGVSH